MSHDTHIASISPSRPRALRCAFLAAALLAAFHCGALQAEDSKIKEDAKKAGHAIGSAAREFNDGAKKIGKAVAKDAVGAAKTVGGAATEGAKAVKRAFTKDKKAD